MPDFTLRECRHDGFREFIRWRCGSFARFRQNDQNIHHGFPIDLPPMRLIGRPLLIRDPLRLSLSRHPQPFGLDGGVAVSFGFLFGFDTRGFGLLSGQSFPLLDHTLTFGGGSQRLSGLTFLPRRFLGLMLPQRFRRL